MMSSRDEWLELWFGPNDALNPTASQLECPVLIPHSVIPGLGRSSQDAGAFHSAQTVGRNTLLRRLEAKPRSTGLGAKSAQCATAYCALRAAKLGRLVIARRRSRQSNPEFSARALECFAALAMTIRETARFPQKRAFSQAAT
jgi:hypothetical protein